VAEALEKNKSLIEFNFLTLSSGNAGALAMSKALTINTSITNLTYYMDEDTPEGISAFAEMMKKNTTLTRLNAPGSNSSEICELLGRNARLRRQ